MHYELDLLFAINPVFNKKLLANDSSSSLLFTSSEDKEKKLIAMYS